MIWQGGLASHGGFTGVLIALYLYVRKYRDMSFLELSDRLVIASLPAAALIRAGNFFNSEILGIPTNLFWAIIFIRVDPLPRHPAMLYESAAYFLVFSRFTLRTGKPIARDFRAGFSEWVWRFHFSSAS